MWFRRHRFLSPATAASITRIVKFHKRGCRKKRVFQDATVGVLRRWEQGTSCFQQQSIVEGRPRRSSRPSYARPHSVKPCDCLQSGHFVLPCLFLTVAPFAVDRRWLAHRDDLVRWSFRFTFAGNQTAVANMAEEAKEELLEFETVRFLADSD